MDSRNRKTYALFGDGTADSIELELPDWVDSDQKEMIRPIPIGDMKKSVIDSAERGFLAAYYILVQINRLKRKKYWLSYEFKSEGEKVIGKSAGLAFALTFLQEALNLDSIIAATGLIDLANADAKVGYVKKIEPKLKAAIRVLPKHGKVFYPSVNNDEIDFDIKQKAREKKIELIPVATLREAIERTIRLPENEKRIQGEKDKGIRFKTLRLWLLILLLVLLCIAVLLHFTSGSDRPIIPLFEKVKVKRTVKKPVQAPAEKIPEKPEVVKKEVKKRDQAPSRPMEAVAKAVQEAIPRKVASTAAPAQKPMRKRFIKLQVQGPEEVGDLFKRLLTSRGLVLVHAGGDVPVLSVEATVKEEGTRENAKVTYLIKRIALNVGGGEVYFKNDLSRTYKGTRERAGVGALRRLEEALKGDKELDECLREIGGQGSFR